MDPFSILGAISAVVELAKASGDAMESLRKTFPESSRFWKHFEEGLQHDRDVPWKEIRSPSHQGPSSPALGRADGNLFGLAAARGDVRLRPTALVSTTANGVTDASTASDAIDAANSSQRRRRLLEFPLAPGRTEVAQR